MLLGNCSGFAQPIEAPTSIFGVHRAVEFVCRVCGQKDDRADLSRTMRANSPRLGCTVPCLSLNRLWVLNFSLSSRRRQGWHHSCKASFRHFVLCLERMVLVLTFKKILCPVDFSDLSLNALRTAVELASMFRAELHLLHVFEGYDAISLNPEVAMSPMLEWLPKLRQLCREKLAALPSGDLAACSPAIVRADREGPAIHEILEYASHEKIDLIVLATHGRTGLQHLLMGSVAENVVRSAKCPVLTVRGCEPCT